MRKLTCDKIIAVSMFLIIVIGMLGYASWTDFIKPIAWQIVKGYSNNEVAEDATPYDKVLNIIDQIETYPNNILGKSVYIETNTIVETVNGAVSYEDAGVPVTKLNNGYLYFLSDKTENVDSYSENLIELQSYLDEKEIDLLYIQAPSKVSQYDNQLADGIEDYSNENADEFLSRIDGIVDYIDLREEMYEDGLNQYDYFFKTDHHWTPEAAFWAFGNVAETLNSDYGFEIDESLWDINNYNVEVYEDWFLGSQGKRVGTWLAGVDDISIITPIFETDFTFEVPANDIYKTGDFSETMFAYENLEKDYWNLSSYHTYIGGDYPLNNITNNLNTDGKKVLLVRDSFACTFAPFLALGCSELDTIDLRYYKDESLMEYIDNNDYDMVIFLYNPGAIYDEMMTFDIVY